MILYYRLYSQIKSQIDFYGKLKVKQSCVLYQLTPTLQKFILCDNNGRDVRIFCATSSALSQRGCRL